MAFKRCIVFLADGSRPDVFRQLMDKGELPNISRYIVEPGCFKDAVTVFPSTTGPAYAPVLTGCFPSTVNIPGIRWFDREKYSRKKLSLSRFRSYVGYETYFMNSDMTPGIKTLFDYFPKSYNIFSPITKGAGFFRNRTKLTKSLYWVFAHYSGRWDLVDNKTSNLIKKIITKDFDFLFTVFPGIDEFAHLDTPFCEKTLEAYKKVDKTLGETVNTLTKQGRLDDTLFVLTSDHGLTATHTHLEVFDVMNSLGYKTFHYPKIHMTDIDAASMVSGNGMANIYMKGNNGWAGKVFYEDIPEKIVNTLILRKEIDLLFALKKNGEVLAVGKEGQAFMSLKDGIINYRISGKDPFGYIDFPAETDPEEALRLTYNTLYPDAPYQVLKLFQSKRTGTIVVNASKGFDLRDRHEHPEHFSTHGSLHREHMIVPFAANVPLKSEYIRNTDIYCLILDRMGKSYNTGKNIDGIIRE